MLMKDTARSGIAGVVKVSLKEGSMPIEIVTFWVLHSSAEAVTN
jgi:hypothetical protein